MTKIDDIKADDMEEFIGYLLQACESNGEKADFESKLTMQISFGSGDTQLMFSNLRHAKYLTKSGHGIEIMWDTHEMWKRAGAFWQISFYDLSRKPSEAIEMCVVTYILDKALGTSRLIRLGKSGSTGREVYFDDANSFRDFCEHAQLFVRVTIRAIEGKPGMFR